MWHCHKILSAEYKRVIRASLLKWNQESRASTAAREQVMKPIYVSHISEVDDGGSSRWRTVNDKGLG